MKQLGELGLMGVAISEENGGTGLDYLVRQDERRRGGAGVGVRRDALVKILHVDAVCRQMEGTMAY